jgi:hypothetical protein
MPNNGTPLMTTKTFKRLTTLIVGNIPDITNELALRFSANADALEVVLREAFTEDRLENALAAVGKKTNPPALQDAPELLLELIGTLTIPATAEKFIAKKKFVVNTDDNAEVKIWDLGSNFKSWLLPKIEEPIAEATMRYHRLRKSSRDLPIITELGGEQKVVTTLSGMYSLLKKQGQGQFGELLTNGYANIFYIYDKDDVPRTVNANWNQGNGWNVNANPIDDPNDWNDDNQVFSGNYSFLSWHVEPWQCSKN